MTSVEIRSSPVDGAHRVEAWHGDVLVGHAEAHPLQLFEHEHYCDVQVVGDHRRRGIGTRLFRALDHELPPRETLVCRVLHRDRVAVSFVDALGHDLVELCPAPHTEPTAAHWSAWAAAQPIADGTVLVGVGDVPAADLEEAWVDYYVWAHEPVGELRPRADIATASSGLSASLDHAVSTLVLRGRRIVALSLVFNDLAEDGITRVLAETRRIDEPDGVRLVASALARTLVELGARGVRLAELEGRTFDPHVPAVVSGFPPHASNPMSVVRLHRRTRRPD